MAFNVDFTPLQLANLRASETRKDLGYAMGSMAPTMLRTAWRGMAGWEEEGKYKGKDYRGFTNDELHAFWEKNISGNKTIGHGDMSFLDWKNTYKPTWDMDKNKWHIKEYDFDDPDKPWYSDIVGAFNPWAEDPDEAQATWSRTQDALKGLIPSLTKKEFTDAQKDRVHRGIFGAPGSEHSGSLFPFFDEEYQDIYKARKADNKRGFGKDSALGAYLYGPENVGLTGEGHKIGTLGKVGRLGLGLGAFGLAGGPTGSVIGALTKLPPMGKAALLLAANEKYGKELSEFDISDFAEKKWGKDSNAHKKAEKFEKQFKWLKTNVLKPTGRQQLDKLDKKPPAILSDNLEDTLKKKYPNMQDYFEGKERAPIWDKVEDTLFPKKYLEQKSPAGLTGRKRANWYNHHKWALDDTIEDKYKTSAEPSNEKKNKTPIKDFLKTFKSGRVSTAILPDGTREEFDVPGLRSRKRQYEYNQYKKTVHPDDAMSFKEWKQDRRLKAKGNDKSKKTIYASHRDPRAGFEDYQDPNIAEQFEQGQNSLLNEANASLQDGTRKRLWNATYGMRPNPSHDLNPEATKQQLHFVQSDYRGSLKEAIESGRGGINRTLTPDELTNAFREGGDDGKQLIKRYITDGLIKKLPNGGFVLTGMNTGGEGREEILFDGPDKNNVYYDYLNKSFNANKAHKTAVDFKKVMKEEKRAQKRIKTPFLNKLFRPKLTKEGFRTKKQRDAYFAEMGMGEAIKTTPIEKIKASAKAITEKANNTVKDMKQARFDNKKLVYNGHNTKITQKEYVEEFLPIFESIDKMWKDANESKDPKYQGFRPTKVLLLEAWIKKKTGSTKGLSDASKRVEKKYSDDPRNPNYRAKKIVEKKKKKLTRKPKVKVKDTGRSWPFRYERI